MRLLPRLSASSRLSQAPLPLHMPLLSPHLLSVMSRPPVSFPLLLSKFENFSALWDKLEDVSLINHHPLSSHFLINCLHLACLPDLGHDSMGFVQMEDLLPQQYRLLTGLKTKCIRMYINLSILNQFFNPKSHCSQCRTLQSVRERKYWRPWNFYWLCMQIKLRF